MLGERRLLRWRGGRGGRPKRKGTAHILTRYTGLQKHSFLHEIAHVLGAHKTSPYPDKRYDIVWTIQHKELVSKESERCVGLDEGLGGHHDPDTVVDEDGLGLELDLDGEEESDWRMGDREDQLVLGDP